jgi:hypothetical protein
VHLARGSDRVRAGVGERALLFMAGRA